jgi:hypothetical protein
MEPRLGIINGPGKKGDGMDVPTRSSGALAFSNLSQTSSSVFSANVSICFQLDCDGELDGILKGETLVFTSKRGSTYRVASFGACYSSRCSAPYRDRGPRVD